MPGSKSYFVRLDPGALLGVEASAIRLQDPALLREQVAKVLTRRYGPSQGRIAARAAEDGRVEVSFVPLRVDDRAERFHRDAIAAAKKRDLRKALQSWNRAIKVNPHDPKYSFHAGVAHFEMGDYEGASDYLLKTISLCSFHHRALLVLGTLYLKLRKLDKAEKFLEASVELVGKDPLGHLNLGAVYSVQRKYDKGIKEFETAIRLSPADPRPHLGLAKVYSLLGKNERAEYYYRQVIKLDKSGTLRRQAQRSMTLVQSTVAAIMPRPEALRPRRRAEVEATGRRLTENGSEAQAATEEWTRLAQKYRSHDPDRLFAGAYQAYLSLDYVSAGELYAGYASLRPSDAAGWYALGETCLRTGELRKAVYAFRKASELEDKPTYYKQLGLSYILLADFEKANKALTRAREMGKKDSVTNLLHGKWAAAAGNFAEAILAFEQAIRANRNNVTAHYELAQALVKNDERALACQRLDELRSIEVDTPLKQKAEELLADLRAAKK